MFYDICEQVVLEAQEKRDFESFKMELLVNFGVESPFSEKEFFESNTDKLTDILFEEVFKYYKKKSDIIASNAFPIIKDVYENQSRYENIAIPITDGHKVLQVVANLKKSFENKGKEVITSVEKGITLALIDDAWKEHLRELDDLKQSVQNASYEQKDPLLIYKFESFELFKRMLQKINKEITSFLIKGNLPLNNTNDVQEARRPQKSDMSKLKTSRDDGMAEAKAQRTSEQQKTQPVKVEKKVGRNDPCPCGSGKKYKNCHGINE